MLAKLQPYHSENSKEVKPMAAKRSLIKRQGSNYQSRGYLQTHMCSPILTSCQQGKYVDQMLFNFIWKKHIHLLS